MESNQLITVDEVGRMAKAIAVSGLFGVKTVEQAAALMFVAQAEGRHPASAAMDYHVIQGRPALKADAMLARFQAAGGSVKWDKYEDDNCTATFSHPQGGTVSICWDMKRAEQAELFKLDKGVRVQMTKKGWQAGNWQKYPRQMLKSRVISEGVRAVYPAVCVGVYTEEEVKQFDSPKSQHVAIPVDAEVVEDSQQVKVNDKIFLIKERCIINNIGWGWFKKQLPSDKYENTEEYIDNCYDEAVGILDAIIAERKSKNPFNQQLSRTESLRQK
jgi:hypothetical protein